MGVYFTKNFAEDIIDYCDKLNSDISKELSSQFYPLPNPTIPLQLVNQLIRKAILLSGDEYLGLHLGEAFHLKATQNVNDLMSRDFNIKEAFQSAVEYSKLISNLMQAKLNISKEAFILQFDIHPDVKQTITPIVAAIIETTLVCAKQSIPFLSKLNLQPTLVQLPYPRPRKVNEYYRVFNCPVQFKSKKSSNSFPT